MKLVKTGLILLFAFFIFYPVAYYILPEGINDKIKDTLASAKNKNSVFCYVVNLDRSKERYQKIKPLIDYLNFPYKRFSAVDGSALSDEEFNKLVDFKTYNNLMGHLPKKGTIGCSLSHINIWKEFLKSDYSYALVIEDDVQFAPSDLQQAVKNVLSHKKIWDVCSFELLHHGFPLNIRNIDDHHHLAIYLTNVTHTGCYLISRKAAQNLLKKALPIKIPIDHYFTRGWELDLTFMGVEPRIVKQDENEQSIIESSEREKASLSQFYLKKVMFKIQTPIIHFLYNLKRYTAVKIMDS